jgi:hypothetical protein
MAKYVEVNGQVIEFPDDMSDSQIESVLAQQLGASQQPAPQERTALQNVGRQIVSNFLPGIPGMREDPENTLSRLTNKAQAAGRQAGLTLRGGLQSALGGFGVADLLIDPLQAAAGMETTSQGRQKLLDAMGFPKPEGRLEENVQTGLDVMTSIGGQVKAAKELTKPVVGLLQGTGTARNVAVTVGDDLGQQLAAGVPAAMVADQVAVAAQDEGADPVTTGVLALSSGLLAGLVGSKSYRGITRDTIPLFTPEMAKNQARASYDKVKQAGVSIKSNTITAAMDDIERGLKQTEGGFYPTALPEHAKVQGMLDSFRNVAKSGPMNFETLDQIRSDALKLARESTDPSTRRLMGQVVEGLDVRMTALQPSDLQSGGRVALGEALSSVREAREAWRRGAKATILEDALEAATRRGVAPTGREGEIIRKNFENLYANKKTMKLFTKEEQEAIKKVATGGKGLEQLLNFTARFNPQRSTLMQAGTLGATVVNPVVGVPVAVGGALSDVALTQLQRQAAKNAMSQIAEGRVKQPRSTTEWRALVEAEAQRLESMNQEPMVAP